MLLESVEGKIVSWIDVKRRFTEDMLRRAFDDRREGSPNAATLQGMVEDAEADVIAFAGKHHSAHCTGPAATAHPYLKKLTLDAMRLLIIERCPGALQGNTEVMEKSMATKLSALSLNKTILHGVTPDATNTGGEVFTNDPNDPTPRPMVFLNGFGDY